MTTQWHKAQNTEKTDTFSAEFWKRHKDALDSGQFWADQIKALRGEPVERLRVAIDNLPLPAGFREAAVATRALIREKRKRKESFERELSLLYWLAAVNSFSVPYSETLREPGYNILQSIPGKTIKTLPFTYHELGYEHLSLLSKTDVKWIEEMWGKPAAHSTLHRMHIEVWKQFEDKLRVIRETERAKFTEEFKALLK
ncbi:MAG TPA: hypothetical protein VJ760_08415 [Nitrospiraceae bacterium]|nr:hypothetical protein [Nitrospiraceae bacterium]